jgi:ATPase
MSQDSEAEQGSEMAGERPQSESRSITVHSRRENNDNDNRKKKEEHEEEELEQLRRRRGGGKENEEEQNPKCEVSEDSALLTAAKEEPSVMVAADEEDDDDTRTTRDAFAGTVVLDTSIIIDGKATVMVESGLIEKGATIIVPTAALDELQAQASRHREEGFVGLEELTRLRTLSDKHGVSMQFIGQRPSMEDIQLARSGRIDAIIRDVARDTDGVLLTADYVQALVAQAQGVRVRHIPAEVKTTGLRFERYFDDSTLSVHLKEGVRPYAKRGLPGNFEYVPIRDEVSSRQELEQTSKEITEAARIRGSVEISRSGATVVQLAAYRIAIARPPFSDGLEITIVRPLVKLTLADYNLSDKLEQRLETKAEGILIAGPPGSGKSTLASSLADFYLEKMKVVKTFESPKDLQVSPGITQYGPLEGDFEKTSEILLLVRPDYTIFDEVRKTRDFEIFADMRLAGVGMVGVVHASDPVNAVQRFMSRLELGMVPHVVDTVIFVKEGRVRQVLELNLVVKVPSGMNEPDLARPVVEVQDFESGKLEYEIYTFGEENVIIPVGEASAALASRRAGSGVERLAKERLLQVFRKYDHGVEVTILSPSRAQVMLDDSVVPKVIGRGGERIRELEKQLSIGIDVRSRSEVPMAVEKKERGTAWQQKRNDDDRVGQEEEEEEEEEDFQPFKGKDEGKPRSSSYHGADDDYFGSSEERPDELEARTVDFEYVERGNSVDLLFDTAMKGTRLRIMSGDELVTETRLGRKTRLKFPKKSEVGKKILSAFREGEDLRIFRS